MPKKQYTNKELMFEKHYILTGKLFLITLAVLGLLFIIGKTLDSALGFELLFKILALLLAFPLIQIIIYMNFKKRS